MSAECESCGGSGFFVVYRASTPEESLPAHRCAHKPQSEWLPAGVKARPATAEELEHALIAIALDPNDGLALLPFFSILPPQDLP